MRVTELPGGVYTDSAILGDSFGTDFYGDLIMCGMPIRTIEYSANFISYEGDRVIRHELYDYADTLGYEGNGAQYRVRSRLPGIGEYNIVFFRNAPPKAGYDPATIFRVTTFTEEVLVATPVNSAVDDETDVGPGPGPLDAGEAEREYVERAIIYELDYRNP
jgi:hypothetical protein